MKRRNPHKCRTVNVEYAQNVNPGMRMANELVADTRRVPVLLRMIKIGTIRHLWPLGASLSEADPSLPFILDISSRYNDASDSLFNERGTLWYERKQ
jgi:hypothetical protein